MDVINYSDWKSLRSFNERQVVVNKIANLSESDIQVEVPRGMTLEQMQDARLKVESAITLMSRGKGGSSESGALKFSAALLMRARIIWDHPRVPTMATDGHNLYISSRFANKLTKEQVIAILVHEMFHVALLHMKRQNKVVGEKPSEKEFEKWNIACDHEVNPILIEEGLITEAVLVGQLKGLYNRKYLGMSAEEIFDKMANEPMPEPPQEEDEDEEDENPDMMPKEGDYIQINDDGRIGQVTKVNMDGSVEFDELSDQEVEELKKVFKTAGNMDNSSYDEI